MIEFRDIDTKSPSERTTRIRIKKEHLSESDNANEKKETLTETKD